MNEDYKAYKYLTELHAHTSPASGCSEIPPETLIETYISLGADAVCITNHFTPAMLDREKNAVIGAYLEDYHRAVSAAAGRINVILGCELRFTENNNDYLLYGIDESDLFDIYDHIDGTVEKFRRSYKNSKLIFLQAHPFRSGMTEVPPELLDGIEVFNMHPNHNSRVGVAARYAAAHSLIPTCGTDYHHPTHEGLGMTRFKTLPQNSHDIAALLRSRDYLFDISGFIVTLPQ